MDHATHLEVSRQKLLQAIKGGKGEVTFIRGYGNIGDELIYAGTRQLLSQTEYAEISIRHLRGASGRIALLAGGGAWCGPYQYMTKQLPDIEKRFEQVIILPSSFDVSVPCVRESLKNTKALIFAREEESYRQIRELCRAEIAHDCAFFFDFNPYRQSGKGTLIAYRQDEESRGYKVSLENNDISLTCESLDEWLWAISRHAAVRTDRAHVMIAAALLGKKVDYRSSNYHKVPAIADFALRNFPVYRNEDDEKLSKETFTVKAVSNNQPFVEKVLKAGFEILKMVPLNESFILIDEDQFRNQFNQATILPFPEKEGQYWGPPADDAVAIKELERLRTGGANFLVIAWPAFWWLDHYKEWYQYLRTNFPCVLENERLVVFDLQSVTVKSLADKETQAGQ